MAQPSASYAWRGVCQVLGEIHRRSGAWQWRSRATVRAADNQRYVRFRSRADVRRPLSYRVSSQVRWAHPPKRPRTRFGGLARSVDRNPVRSIGEARLI